MKSQRLARIDHEMQRVLATLISQELKDPRLGFLTVTRVEVADDLNHAKVYVSVIGDRHVAKQSMEALERASGFLRGELGHRIDLRHTPELNFIEDRSTERAIEMSKTLRQVAPPVEVKATEPEDAE
ncbi:MAG: 30S ribosome-binding factor RbfA [Vulcanimicrobiaceae bacterium]